jgi:hypothetical protein
MINDKQLMTNNRLDNQVLLEPSITETPGSADK